MEVESMANPLSKELREKIVSAYARGLGTINEIAEIFCITPRTVSKYLQIHRETGDLTPKPLPGRPLILTDENLNIIKKIILQNKDGTLRDFRDAFESKVGICVAISTMQNACDKLDIRRKKRVFMHRNKNA
jgi:transposase